MSRTKVFCIGLGKTGTTTFGSCMRELGYRHCTGPYLAGAYLARRQSIDVLLRLGKEFDSFDDYPWPLIYEQLYQNFPDAYFVLTRRKSSAAWYRSVCKHYDRYGASEIWRLVFDESDPRLAPQSLIDFYESHNIKTRSFFAGRTDRFTELCWEEGDGWSELCGFLGVKAPKTSLSNKNDSTTVDDRRLLTRLVHRGEFSHATWYARNRSSRPAQALAYLDEEIIKYRIDPLLKGHLTRRLSKAIVRHFTRLASLRRTSS